jgi:hypothetical protein
VRDKGRQERKRQERTMTPDQVKFVWQRFAEAEAAE